MSTDMIVNMEEFTKNEDLNTLMLMLGELVHPQEALNSTAVLQRAIALIKDLQRENAILAANSNSSGCPSNSNGSTGEGSDKEGSQKGSDKGSDKSSDKSNFRDRDAHGDVSDNSLDSEESSNSNANSSETTDSFARKGATKTRQGCSGAPRTWNSTDVKERRKSSGDHALTKSNIKRASDMHSKGQILNCGECEGVRFRESTVASCPPSKRAKRDTTNNAKPKVPPILSLGS